MTKSPKPKKPDARQRQAMRDRLKNLPQDPHLAAEALLGDESLSDDKQVVEMVRRALQKRGASQDLIEALIVRLGNMAEITLHGREVKDRITHPGQPNIVDNDPKGDKRNHYQIGPYALPSATASAICLWKQEETGELYVLLGQRQLKEGGLSTTMILPGGFMDPKPRPGHESRPYDRDLKASAKRELLEEVTLNAPKGKDKIRLVRLDSRVSAKAPAHMVSSLWLMDFGSGDVPPSPIAADDLGHARWVPVNRVMKLQNMPAQPYVSDKSRYVIELNGKRHQILDRQGESIEMALRDYREAELAKLGQTRDGLTRQMRLLERSSKQPKGKLLADPEHSEFGRAAHSHHLKCLLVAGKLRNAMRKQAATLLDDMGMAPKADRRAPVLRMPHP